VTVPLRGLRPYWTPLPILKDADHHAKEIVKPGRRLRLRVSSSVQKRRRRTFCPNIAATPDGIRSLFTLRGKEKKKGKESKIRQLSFAMRNGRFALSHVGGRNHVKVVPPGGEGKGEGGMEQGDARESMRAGDNDLLTPSIP